MEGSELSGEWSTTVYRRGTGGDRRLFQGAGKADAEGWEDFSQPPRKHHGGVGGIRC